MFINAEERALVGIYIRQSHGVTSNLSKVNRRVQMRSGEVGNHSVVLDILEVLKVFLQRIVGVWSRSTTTRRVCNIFLKCIRGLITTSKTKCGSSRFNKEKLQGLMKTIAKQTVTI